MVQAPEFKVVVEDDTGKLWLKSYLFDGTRAKLTSKAPYEPSPDAPPVSNRSKPLPETDMSWFEKLMKLLPGRD